MKSVLDGLALITEPFCLQACRSLNNQDDGHERILHKRTETIARCLL